jgi:hypothetical protein
MSQGRCQSEIGKRWVPWKTAIYIYIYIEREREVGSGVSQIITNISIEECAMAAAGRNGGVLEDDGWAR